MYMWFIKKEFLDEFKKVINSYQNEMDMIRKIKVIKEIEKFCKQGKGISFYNRRTLNQKYIKELEKYKIDKNFYEYNISEI